MSLPEQRVRGLLSAIDLVHDLTDPKETPGVPSIVRVRARRAVKHWPRLSLLEEVLLRLLEAHYQEMGTFKYTNLSATEIRTELARFGLERLVDGLGDIELEIVSYPHPGSPGTHARIKAKEDEDDSFEGTCPTCGQTSPEIARNAALELAAVVLLEKPRSYWETPMDLLEDRAAAIRRLKR